MFRSAALIIAHVRRLYQQAAAGNATGQFAGVQPAKEPRSIGRQHKSTRLQVGVVMQPNRRYELPWELFWALIAVQNRDKHAKTRKNFFVLPRSATKNWWSEGDSNS